MKVEYINPFLASALSTFDTMLGWKLTRGSCTSKKEHSHSTK